MWDKPLLQGDLHVYLHLFPNCDAQSHFFIYTWEAAPPAFQRASLPGGGLKEESLEA